MLFTLQSGLDKEFTAFIQVQNAIDFLKMIGALDEGENLTHLGLSAALLLDYAASSLFLSFICIVKFTDYFCSGCLLGEFLAMLPLDPKLGKMLIMGAIFRCFDPILTIVAGLSVRDPFLLPQDKKDVSI